MTTSKRVLQYLQWLAAKLCGDHLSTCEHVYVCAWSGNTAWSWAVIISLSLSLSGEWVRVCVSNLYPEDIVLRYSRHRLLQAFIHLLLHSQVSRDGPPDLWTNIVQRPQARLHDTDTNTTQVLHLSWNNTLTDIFILAVKTLKQGHLLTCTKTFINFSYIYIFMIKGKQNLLCVCVPAEKGRFWEATLATSPCSFLFLNLRKYSWMRKVA